MTNAFGFIVHPLTEFQRRVFGVRALDWGLAIGGSSPAFNPVKIASSTIRIGQRDLNGTLVSLPGLPEELLSDQGRSVAQLIQAVRVCESQNCSVVGLGGVAAMVGGQGKALSKSVAVPITSGNHLTGETAFQTTLRLLGALTTSDWLVSIVGLPSPVGILLLNLLCRHGVRIELVSQRLPTPLQRLVTKLNREWKNQITVVPSVQDTTAPVLIAASSTGAGILLTSIPPNTVVIDVAAPADIIEDKQRKDVIVIDGEYLSPPNVMRGDLWQRIYKRLTHQPAVLLACFVEPMLIATSKETGLCGIGRTLDTDKAQALGQLAVRHGFIVDGLYRHGQPVDVEAVSACLNSR